MRKRQCKICNRSWNKKDDSGEVVSVVTCKGLLPGNDNEAFLIKCYTVICSKCGRTWMYQKKKR